jgi:hypothetical protein
MGFEALDGLPRAALIFGVLAVVFAALALRDRVRFGPAMTPSRKAWLRVAVIFAIVTIVIVLQRA